MRKLIFALMLLPLTVCRGETLVYLGTYTRGVSEGIYVSRLNTQTGEMSEPRLAAKLENPSFVAMHPSGKFLYAVSEVGAADAMGVTAYSIVEDGSLKKLNARSTKGGAACHLQVDPTGRCLGVANYTGGSCASYPINQDGSLGEIGSFFQHEGGSMVDKRRQEAPHAHSINFNADGTQAFVADLGMDQIRIYDVDAATGKMVPSAQRSVKLPPGGGPRHFSLAPDQSVAFSNLELTSQVLWLDYSTADRTLAMGSVASTLPAAWDESGNSTAECLLHPNGGFVYVSNRGHNSIAVFRWDTKTKTLVLLENEPTQGEIPRGFGITSDGKFLIAANQKSASVVSYRIESNGQLTPTGHRIRVDMPVNVRFLER
ncbi:MAG: lactonase family protein [Planctomycetota bacterium]